MPLDIIPQATEAPIKAPGIYKVSPAVYHADPCPAPSLSNSIARILLNRSPRHAWVSHPRLNPDFQPDEPDNRLDFGTVAHSMLLGQGREIVVVIADDWRTNAAKAARAKAADDGKVAVLAKDYNRAVAMTDAAREQLKLIEDCELAFSKGHPELMLAWQEFPLVAGLDPAAFQTSKSPDDATPLNKDTVGDAGSVTAGETASIWCRSLVDWLEPRRQSGQIIAYDYKSTSGIAAPGPVSNHLYSMDYHLQAAFIERGLEALIGDVAGRVIFRFIVQEKEEPYLLTPVELDPAGMTIGRKMAAAAIDIWRRCLVEGVWPGYPCKVVTAELPAYLERAWLQREMEDSAIGDTANDPLLLASPWIPPSKPKPIDILGSG